MPIHESDLECTAERRKPLQNLKLSAVNKDDQIMSFGTSPSFTRYIGIDYSGAQTPTTSLKGLRVYLVDQKNVPTEALPPPSPRKYWTRRGLAEWLIEINWLILPPTFFAAGKVAFNAGSLGTAFVWVIGP